MYFNSSALPSSKLSENKVGMGDGVGDSLRFIGRIVILGFGGNVIFIFGGLGDLGNTIDGKAKAGCIRNDKKVNPIHTPIRKDLMINFLLITQHYSHLWSYTSLTKI